MKWLKIHRNVQTLFGLLWDKDRQAQYYDIQKWVVKGLSLHEWFAHLISYREIEADDALRRLSSKDTSIEHIRYRQARYDSAITFLDWIDRMRE